MAKKPNKRQKCLQQDLDNIAEDGYKGLDGVCYSVPSDWMNWFRSFWGEWPDDILLPTVTLGTRMFYDGVYFGQIHSLWYKRKSLCSCKGDSIVRLQFRISEERVVFCNFYGTLGTITIDKSDFEIVPAETFKIYSSFASIPTCYFCLAEEKQKKVFWDVLRRYLELNL